MRGGLVQINDLRSILLQHTSPQSAVKEYQAVPQEFLSDRDLRIEWHERGRHIPPIRRELLETICLWILHPASVLHALYAAIQLQSNAANRSDKQDQRSRYQFLIPTMQSQLRPSVHHSLIFFLQPIATCATNFHDVQ